MKKINILKLHVYANDDIALNSTMKGEWESYTLINYSLDQNEIIPPKMTDLFRISINLKKYIYSWFFVSVSKILEK